MPEPITYSERFFSADGTEINVGANAGAFHDATLANRTQGGFDAVNVTIGRFTGQVNVRAVDADNVQVDVESSLSDGSSTIRLQANADGSRRIAAVTVNYFPDGSPFEFFSVVFWDPSAPFEVVSDVGVAYGNVAARFPWVTKEPVGHLQFDTDTFYDLTINGPVLGAAGDLTFTGVVDHLDGNLPGHSPAPLPLTATGRLRNFQVFLQQSDGTVVKAASNPQLEVSIDLSAGAPVTFPLPAGWVGVTFNDQSYYKNYTFSLGTVVETPTDTGGGGTGGSGIVLAGSVDPHAGWGAGELRGFQSGPQQIVSAAGTAQSPLSQWIVRESGRSYTTAGATTGTDTSDPGSGSSS